MEIKIKNQNNEVLYHKFCDNVYVSSKPRNRETSITISNKNRNKISYPIKTLTIDTDKVLGIDYSENKVCVILDINELDL